MTLRVWAWLYDPTTAGLLLGASRLGVGLLGGSRIPDPARLGYSRLGASRLGRADSRRQWLELDPEHLTAVTYTRGIKTDVPYRAAVGTLTATWLHGAADPALHPGLIYGTPVVVTAADPATVLWSGRLTALTIRDTGDDSTVTWDGVDVIADLAGVRWAEGQFTSLYFGGPAFAEVLAALASGPWWAPSVAADLNPGSPPGDYLDEPVTPGSAAATTVDYVDIIAATVGAAWWAAPTFDLTPDGNPAVGSIRYAHALDLMPDSAVTYSDEAAPSYTRITAGLTTEGIINRFECSSVAGAADAVISDPSSVASYGPRTRRYRDGSVTGSHPGAAAWLRIAAAPPSYAATSITLDHLPEGLDVWSPIDVLRRGRTTHARVAHITHAVTPDHRRSSRTAVTLRLIERT